MEDSERITDEAASETIQHQEPNYKSQQADGAMGDNVDGEQEQEQQKEDSLPSSTGQKRSYDELVKISEQGDIAKVNSIEGFDADNETMDIVSPVSRKKEASEKDGGEGNNEEEEDGGGDNGNIDSRNVERKHPESIMIEWDDDKQVATVTFRNFHYKNDDSRDNDNKGFNKRDEKEEEPAKKRFKEGTAVVAAAATSMQQKEKAMIQKATNGDDDDDDKILCLGGRANVKCIQGSVEVLGYTLTAGEQTYVTSPCWNSWLTFYPIFTSSHHTDHSSFSSSIIIKFTSIRGTPSFKLVVTTITSSPSSCHPTIIPPCWKEASDKIIQDCFYQKRQEQEQERRQQNSNVPSVSSSAAFDEKSFADKDTNTKNNHRHPIQRIVICGAKGVGKSTMLRYLTNRMLSPSSSITSSSSCTDDPNTSFSEVMILDADVGQPELVPPGILGLSIVRRPLLQPPYCNIMPTSDDDDNDDEDKSRNDKKSACGTETISSIFYGAYTSKVDPSRYIANVQSLLEEYKRYCNEKKKHNNDTTTTTIPLLINMDGWIRSIGYHILTTLIKDTIQPSHICQLVGANRDTQFHLAESLIIRHDGDDDGNNNKVNNNDNGYGDNDDNNNNVKSINKDNVPKVFKCNDYSKYIMDLQSKRTGNINVNDAMSNSNNNSKNNEFIKSSTWRTLRLAAYFGGGDDGASRLQLQEQLWDKLDMLSTRHFLRLGWKIDNVARFDPTSNNNDENDDVIENDEKNNNNKHKKSNNVDDNNESFLLARNLASQLPYCVPFEAVNYSWISSDHGDDGDGDLRTNEQILQAMNGSIVGLCRHRSVTSSMATTTTTTSSTSSSSLSSSYISCIGLGIIRSIDWQKQLFYILTPIRSNNENNNILASVTHLIGGYLTMPLSLVYRGIYAESFPYQTWTMERPVVLDDAGEKQKSKKNKKKKNKNNDNNTTRVAVGTEPMKSRNNIQRYGGLYYGGGTG